MSHHYAGDDAATAGYGMAMGGWGGAKHPQPSSTYPRDSDQEQNAFYTVDANKGWGHKLKGQPGVANLAPGSGEPVVTFEAVADTGILRRKSIAYLPPEGQAGPAYFVNYQDRRYCTVHRGGDASGQMIGTVKIPLRITHASFTLNNASSEQQQQQQQEFERSGFTNKTWSCKLPAVRNSAEPTFTWKRTSDYGASRIRGGSNVLVDASGQEYAAYVRGGVFKTAEGTLKILRPDLSPEAIDQIVVSCVALQEILRRTRDNATGASANSSSAAVASIGSC